MATNETWSYEATAEKVMAHALNNYEKGWDVIVECMTIPEIAATLRGRRIWSESGAIKYFAQQVRFHREAAANAAW